MTASTSADDRSHHNAYFHPGVGEYRILDAIRHVREAGRLPDGTAIPRHLKPMLLTLATYWPVIRPTLPQLARDTGLGRNTVAEHLRELSDLGLVRTHHVGRAAYRMLQLDQMVTVSEHEPRELKRPGTRPPSSSRLARIEAA